MPESHAPPPRPLRESNQLAPPPHRPLSKQMTWSPATLLWEAAPPGTLIRQRSWSPDVRREEAWRRRRKENRRGFSRGVTDGDMEELKACIELGFGFDSPEIDPKLAETLPALGLYRAVNKQLKGDDPEAVKARLRQWAQVVACSVRQGSGAT